MQCVGSWGVRRTRHSVEGLVVGGRLPHEEISCPELQLPTLQNGYDQKGLPLLLPASHGIVLETAKLPAQGQELDVY